MKTARPLELKVVPIGNSRGVRLPRKLMAHYLIRDSVIVEAREDGLLLRSKRDTRLSWEETYAAMAKESDDWSDLESVAADGLDRLPW